ncbi:GDP-mannose 4,6-dehydratase [Streptomyces lichenis]|uniref:GDP-mannose 4,6-dehydratase n=1 Tax=Streptomyces lichenis TaxID=2306967 RepID=A0ABT0I855_9ACTN|nr:GDP-mannose 4,6-dehydratase [Streptomyces lichenis]MCK8677510.1 GDP-mannose 4,6-dehydratase [Streptomyces lichenis]
MELNPTPAIDWTGRTVLVTGAEGFIGSTLVDQLLERGARVRAFAHYKPYGEKGNLAHLLGDIELIAGDVRDPGRVMDAVADCDTVFHLAALIGIPYSYDSPGAYVQTNVNGTENIAEACRRHGVRRLVHTSTSEVYGTARTAPISEDHPLQPQSPYSASKIGADMMALSHWHAFELPVTVVRPFNTYGPRQSARAVIPAILAQLHAGVRELRLGSLTPTRDFTYAADTARGFLALADCDRALGQVVNLGSGQEIAIGDLARRLIEASGRDGVEITTDRERLRPSGSEVERLLSDNRRAREWAGWRPEVSLEEGLKHTSEWVAEHLHLFAPDRYQV